jgi:hypothetical protein
MKERGGWRVRGGGDWDEKLRNTGAAEIYLTWMSSLRLDGLNDDDGNLGVLASFFAAAFLALRSDGI